MKNFSRTAAGILIASCALLVFAILVYFECVGMCSYGEPVLPESKTPKTWTRDEIREMIRDEINGKEQKTIF